MIQVRSRFYDSTVIIIADNMQGHSLQAIYCQDTQTMDLSDAEYYSPQKTVLLNGNKQNCTLEEAESLAVKKLVELAKI